VVAAGSAAAGGGATGTAEVDGVAKAVLARQTGLVTAAGGSMTRSATAPLRCTVADAAPRRVRAEAGA
jgi:hypothetical protein